MEEKTEIGFSDEPMTSDASTMRAPGKMERAEKALSEEDAVFNVDENALIESDESDDVIELEDMMDELPSEVVDAAMRALGDSGPSRRGRFVTVPMRTRGNERGCILVERLRLLR